MSPAIASRHLPDGSGRHAVVFSDRLVLLSRLTPEPDRRNLRLVQLGVSVARALSAWRMIGRLRAACGAALLVSVAHVLGVSPKPQVARANTGRDVARMADAQAARRDFPVRQFPRDTMRQSWRTAIISDATVSIALFCARPQPAIAGGIDARPELARGVHDPILQPLRESA